MKRVIFFVLLGLLGLTAFPQRFKVETFTDSVQYRKHYSHSIEEGFINGDLRQFIVGNETDKGLYNKAVTGQSVNGPVFLHGRRVSVDEKANFQLTDFTAYAPDDSRFAAGTGVYYPDGVTGAGFPFLGIYERGNMQLINAMFFYLSYYGNEKASTTAGLRIKYSEKARAYFISGVMLDRRFIDVTMPGLICKTKGFILKVDARDWDNTNVLVFDPEPLPETPKDPLYCAVTDLEINPDGNRIAFTGITTKAEFNHHYHPMAGMIDLDLNLQWCYAYSFVANRYSGVDVEFGKKADDLFVLLNSDANPFAVMQLNSNNGSIVQQPVNYEFFLKSRGTARAHIMHFIDGKFIITGNCFVEDIDPHREDQLLFSYEIPDAYNLQSGNNYFNSYSREIVPAGSQKAVYSFWTPENSIFQKGNLSIVGVYNNQDLTFGYTLIQVKGFENEEGCLETGDVLVREPVHSNLLECNAYLTHCKRADFRTFVSEIYPHPIQECPKPGNEKSGTGSVNDINSSAGIWQYKGLDAGGVHAVLISETKTVYEVNVYDASGRKIQNCSYKVTDGQKEIYLKFATNPELYFITINNGSRIETLKISGSR
jgi:hypothetical protein